MSFIDQVLNPARRFERAYAEQLISRFRYLPGSGALAELEAEWIEPRGWNAALARDPRLNLTGAAGAGKTTALAYLVLSNARALLAGSRHARVPIFLSGRDLSPAALPRITDFPRGLFLPDALATQCPRIFFPDVFTSSRALVLIDDIDALPLDALQAWVKDLSSARVVATSQAPVPGFIDVPLPGFRDGDIETFAVQVERRNGVAGAARAFVAALKANGVPRALTANPLTFTLLARVWRADQPLPNRRTTLFDAYAGEILRGDFETAKMLEGVALAIQRGRPASDEFLPKARGLMRAGKNKTAEFAHELWQAYFAARALRQAPDLASLAEHLAEPAWWDTALFYAGLGDASELVETLMARGNSYLAGRAVAHAQGVRQELRDAVTKELISRAWDGDGSAIAALSEMASDGAVDWFAKQLKDKDPAVRTRAAEILGWLQLDRGIEYLLPQLRDVNADVRDKVVEALGRARTDRVIEPLLVALRGDARVGTVDTRLRIAAAKALGEVASDKALPALLVDLQIGEPDVRAVAAQALQRITSPLMLKPLQGVLQSGDEEAKKYAAEILAIVDGKNS
ncbi:MAG: HEAT repeat domain-containing protein [Chloroflexota bacterium]|nr:HEAT repeat domain-containing protein [Chloroflexota bacterium]